MSQAFTTKYPYMNHKPTTTKETEDIIKVVWSKNSLGCDESSSKTLSSPFIRSLLNYICDKTLSTGIFPHILLHSIIQER